MIIISSIVVVVLVAALSAFLIIQNILRGGSATPEEAGNKIIESINDKDVVALFGMVSPRERDAVLRLQEQATKTFSDNGIAEAIKLTSSASTENSAIDTELSLDGVDFTLAGTTPVVTELSEDYALIQFTTGEITLTVRPEETKGLIRAGFDSSGDMETVNEREFIANLGPQKSGITLVASKTDGRWYVSPMLSALDGISAWSSYDSGYGSANGSHRGMIPASFTPGEDKPEDAATAGIQAMVNAVNQQNPQLLAPTLAKDEAAAFSLYAGLWDSSGASSNSDLLTLGEASFTAGTSSGDRAHAIAKNISVGIGDDEHVVFTENCMEDAQKEKLCLNGSGYFNDETASNAISLASIDGKFALTTVKEDGQWKVSLLDSVSDMAASWLKSLTPEQTLALLGLERAADANGEITVGTKVSVPLNSAGYAVQNFTVDQDQKVSLASDTSMSAEIYSADGEGRMAQDSLKCSTSGTDQGCDVAAGKYTLVLNAAESEQWSTGFKNEGNDFQLAPELTIQRYVDPPLIDGSTAPAYISMGMTYPSASISIPEKTSKKLILEFDEFTTVPDVMELTVGDKSISLDGRTNKRIVIDSPQETGNFTIYFEGQGDSWNWYGVTANLYFADE